MVLIAARSDAEPQDEARLHVRIAEVALKRGDAATAISELRKAVALEPGNSTLRYRLAIAEKERDPRAALESVRQAGSWNFGPWALRASSRYGLDPAVRSVNLGVRCVRDIAP